MTTNKEDTINKSLLLNWLYSADKDLTIAELGRWIEAKTNGEYVLIKKIGNNNTSPLNPLEKV